MAQLNHCTACKKIIGDNVSTCPHCGTNQNSASKGSSRGTGSSRVPAFQTNKTQEKFREIVRKHKKAEVTALIAGVISVVVGLGLLLNQAPVYGLIGFLGLIISVFMYVDVYWTSEEYYSLPGSRDTNGKHRCIHCGNIGIFNRGQYATNNKHSQCSKCDAHLFSGTRD